MVTCPICEEKVPTEVDVFREHLEEEHGIDTSGIEKRGEAGLNVYPTYEAGKPLASYEWGEPFDADGRETVPRNEKSRELKHGELHQEATNENGNPVRITKPREVTRKVVSRIKDEGAEPQYIRIQGSRIMTQYSASPIPWAIVALIVLAVVVLLIINAVTTFLKKVYNVLIKPLPDWLEPVAIGGIAIAGGYVLYKGYDTFTRG